MIMILPIVAFGNPVLRKKCNDMSAGSTDLNKLIPDMWHTLYNAKGCGLAAPQVDLAYRLFMVDSVTTFRQMDANERLHYFSGDEGIKQVFINAQIVSVTKDDIWEDEEGCLSIPGITVPVKRPWQLTIKYEDANFNEQVKTFAGITARMVQHEYDHVEGRLLVDYLNPLQKHMLRNKLNNIRKHRTNYPMIYK
jgi:peptide deformylase